MIGDKIRELRRARGWTQSELAARAKLTQSAIAKYESGKSVPGDDVKRIMAELFNVSVDYLLDYRHETDKGTAAERQILDLFRLLNEDGQRTAITVVKGLLLDARNVKKAAVEAI